MTTEVGIGSGSEFWLDNASNVLTQLDEIISVALPNSQTADVEATHMASPNRRREYISGLIDDGEGTIQMNYVPGSATDILIRAAQSDGLTRSFKVVLPVAEQSENHALPDNLNIYSRVGASALLHVPESWFTEAGMNCNAVSRNGNGIAVAAAAEALLVLYIVSNSGL